MRARESAGCHSLSGIPRWRFASRNPRERLIKALGDRGNRNWRTTIISGLTRIHCSLKSPGLIESRRQSVSTAFESRTGVRRHLPAGVDQIDEAGMATRSSLRPERRPQYVVEPPESLHFSAMVPSYFVVFGIQKLSQRKNTPPAM
jgi:hypothetical protein